MSVCSGYVVERDLPWTLGTFNQRPMSCTSTNRDSASVRETPLTWDQIQQRSNNKSSHKSSSHLVFIKCSAMDSFTITAAILLAGFISSAALRHFETGECCWTFLTSYVSYFVQIASLCRSQLRSLVFSSWASAKPTDTGLICSQLQWDIQCVLLLLLFKLQHLTLTERHPHP